VHLGQQASIETWKSGGMLRAKATATIQITKPEGLGEGSSSTRTTSLTLDLEFNAARRHRERIGYSNSGEESNEQGLKQVRLMKKRLSSWVGYQPRHIIGAGRRTHNG
jgi:hypothetical protein